MSQPSLDPDSPRFDIFLGVDARSRCLAYEITVHDGDRLVWNAYGFASDRHSWSTMLATISDAVRALCTLSLELDTGWNEPAAWDALIAGRL